MSSEGAMNVDLTTQLEAETMTVDEPEVKLQSDDAPGVTCFTLDLNTFAAKYEGRTKLNRLFFIAENCINLRTEAYFLLLNECMKGNDTETYKKYVELSSKFIGTTIDLDRPWIEATERKMSLRYDRLLKESNGARSSMIHDSIRLSYSDLGYHHYEIGDLPEAQRLFLRMRDFCSTTRHHSDMAFSIVNVLLDLKQFVSIPSFLTKASSWTDVISIARTKVIMGIYELTVANYSESAKYFLSVEKELESSFASVIAAEDIGIYGALLGVASLPLIEFKKFVETKSFKAYLELIPDVKVFVSNYLSRSYGDCLNYINLKMNEWTLDIYLNKHIDSIVTMIRDKVVCQYFTPYSSVSLEKMSRALCIDMETLEMQLFDLIVAMKLDAVINDENKTLSRKSVINRKVLLDNIRRLGESHLKTLKCGLLRLNIIKNNLALYSIDGGEAIGRIDSGLRPITATFPSRRSDLTSEPRVLQSHEEGFDDAEDED